MASVTADPATELPLLQHCTTVELLLCTVQCATFTGMRDLRESNNLQKRINSGIYTISIPDTTLKQSIKLYAGITTISIISKDIQGYKYMDIHGYPGQPAHEGY